MEKTRKLHEMVTWYCDCCNRGTTVSYPREESDFFQVVVKLDAEHRSISPDCEASRYTDGYNLLRVINGAVPLSHFT